MPNPRQLKVLTRKEGVRSENPLLATSENGYYAVSGKTRTPEIREEADEVLQKEDPEMAKKYGLAKKALK